MSTLTSNAPREFQANYADLPQAAEADEQSYLGLPLSAWIRIGTIGLLFACLFWPNLRRLWDKTNPFYGEANWGHAMFVPLVGLYYLYVNRDKLLSARLKIAWEGLAITVLGIGLFAWAIWPLQNDWVKDVGMVVTLFGVVTFMCGWDVMRTAWFPIVFLICALPWPGLFYSFVASPLQHLAALVAVRVLKIVGVDSAPYGTKIFIVGQNGAVRTLNVAEACAGLRSLMTFVSIAAAIAFLSVRPLWQKLILVASAIPIAIFCNTMRVAGQGILDHYFSQQWSESFAHGFVGLVMMIPAFFLIMLVGWVLQNIFVEEVDDKDELRSGRPAVARAGAGGTATAAPTVIRRTTTARPAAAAPAASAPAQQTVAELSPAPTAPKADAAPRAATVAPAAAPKPVAPRAVAAAAPAATPKPAAPRAAAAAPQAGSTTTPPRPTTGTAPGAAVRRPAPQSGAAAAGAPRATPATPPRPNAVAGVAPAQRNAAAPSARPAQAPAPAKAAATASGSPAAAARPAAVRPQAVRPPAAPAQPPRAATSEPQQQQEEKQS